MTGYPERIEAARADLAALEKDAQELQRLHAGKAAELEGLRASGSRDFARMAEIEGQRSALATMCADQEAEVGRARAALAVLEAEAVRDERLSMIGHKAREIEAARQDLHARRIALRDALPALLLPLLDADTRWGKARQEWIALAGELGVNVHQYGGDDAGTSALYAELEARGVNTLPLRWSRGNTYEVRGSVNPEPLTLPPAETPFAEHLGHVVNELLTQASVALHRAQGGEVGQGVALGHSPTIPQFQQNVGSVPVPSFLAPPRRAESGS